MSHWYTREDDVVTLALHVQPGAKHTECVGLYGNALKIRLASLPIDGRANADLLAFVATIFEVPLRQVKLKRGDCSRRKLVTISGSTIDPEHLLFTK